MQSGTTCHPLSAASDPKVQPSISRYQFNPIPTNSLISSGCQKVSRLKYNCLVYSSPSSTFFFVWRLDRPLVGSALFKTLQQTNWFCCNARCSLWLSLHPCCQARNTKTIPVNVDNDVKEDGSVYKQHDADRKVIPKKLTKISIEKASPERLKIISSIQVHWKDLPMTKPRFVHCTLRSKHFYKDCSQT